jgi:cytochrome c-type protein NapB
VPDRRATARTSALLAAAIVAVAFIGLLTGTERSTYQAKRPPVIERPDPGNVPPARTHAELEVRPWGSSPEQSGWREALRIAASAASSETADGDSVDQVIRERVEQRAFDGAPPVVPHPVRAGGAAECLACHGEGFVLGARRAAGVPHADFASCTQCHVSSAAAFTVVSANPAFSAENSWKGLEARAAGAVAYPGAPPAVPHSTWMRDQCESCHGSDGRVALRTPHPERQSCLQCHPATGERSDQRAR